MQQLNQDIDNLTFKRVYLLYGDEDYLRKQYKDKLIKALMPDGDTMNFNRYEGKDIEIGDTIISINDVPYNQVKEWELPDSIIIEVQKKNGKIKKIKSKRSFFE